MGISSFEDVLYHEMKDLLSAEKQFRDAMPKLAEAVTDRDLAGVFVAHQRETETHVARLERGFELLGKAVRSEKCDAADGLVEEGRGLIEEDGEAPYKDIAFAGSGRKVEHYEIVSYMDAIAHAQALGHDELADLLGETLAEERAADLMFERIATNLGAAALRAN